MENQKSKPLRVLCITRAYGEHGGGMERLSYELINQLQELPNVETIVIPHKGKRITSPLHIATGLVQGLFQASKADVVHIGDPMLSATGWVLKKIFKKPVAVTVHGLDLSWNFPPYQWYLNMFFKSFDAYLPISKYVKDITEQHTSSKEVQVINPGIHDRFYDPSIQSKKLKELLEKHGVTVGSSTKTLLTTGRLAKRKGHAWFIQNALNQLPTDTVYIIAGDGPEKDHIQELAKTSQNKVITLGRASDETLKTLYNTCDAFIQPNIHIEHDAEGFGLVLLEAALCGLPVYAAGIEGITDAIHNEQNGVLLASEDAQTWVDRLTVDLNKGLEKDLSARQFTLENFSWSQQTQKLYQALSRLSTNSRN